MQKKIFDFFKNSPVFVLLLPVFFVLHGYSENFGFISLIEALVLMFIYCIVAITFCLLLFPLFRNVTKASLLTVWGMTFFLFFGAAQDFLKATIPFAARYSVMLSLFLFVAAGIIIYFKHINRILFRVVLFLNVLLCIYVSVDVVSICLKIIKPPANKFSVNLDNEGRQSRVLTNSKDADIYFLVFDEFASSQSLKEHYGFLNPIDTFLMNRGFRVQQQASSNYHFTWLSIASILNMSYINSLPYNKVVNANDIGYAMQLIKKNEVINFLSKRAYTVANFSIFDLERHPSPVNQVLLPVDTKLITENTLLARADKDLGWMLTRVEWLNYRGLDNIPKNNLALLKMTKSFSGLKRQQPAFIYAHFFLPHSPFFFDKNGRMKEMGKIIAEQRGTYQNVHAYLEYLQYANSEIQKLVDTIQHNTEGKAVIILMSDHGFREDMDTNSPQNFEMLNAVYLPDRNYSMLYDSISGVNQFRVIFNTLFHESFPLLKDSTVFLRRAGPSVKD